MTFHLLEGNDFDTTLVFAVGMASYSTLGESFSYG